MVQDNSEQGMPEDIKGKGTATHRSNLLSSTTGQDDRPDSTQAGAHTTSIMSRLGASASKLTEDMVLRYPRSTQVADALPSGKAESSRAAKAGSIQEASSYKNHPPPATFGGTFKSTRLQGQSISDESSFSSFLDGTSVLEVTGPGNIERHAYEQGYEEGYDPKPRQISQTSVIMATDGMDVVNLLDSQYDEVDETDIPLTDDEQVALRYHLFEDDGNSTDSSSLRKGWEDVLNFFPDFKWNSNGPQELADLLGTSDLDEARRVWINQWQCVLSSYTDEVWGDLSPLVNVAREELSSLTEPLEALPSKPKALRRLQQILTHVRGM
ncbi:hypothetical protein F4781DRAFT_415914 [Annulohypoxylon bovei var. microspora]|nr:hypothetical protein F4781DRAFT_415914 [Annulohypoxylon bovei var. microspora]